MANIGSYIVRVRKADKSGWNNIPRDLIAYEKYQVTPDQRIDLDSHVSETGYLQRNVLDHTRTKIEFETPYINDTQWKSIWDVITAGFTDAQAQKCTIQYYNPKTNTNDVATCYVPDIELHIRNIDFPNHVINYDPVRIAFIQY